MIKEELLLFVEIEDRAVTVFVDWDLGTGVDEIKDTTWEPLGEGTHQVCEGQSSAPSGRPAPSPAGTRGPKLSESQSFMWFMEVPSQRCDCGQLTGRWP